MSKIITVVGGCGHVGLPLAIALAAHHQVRIFDIDSAAVARVRRGEMPFRDAGAEEALRDALKRGLVVSDSPESLEGAEVLVVVIGTPVDEHLNPSFGVFDQLLNQLAEYMGDGQTLLLRSTVYPGTSERVQRELNLRGLKVEVAFCPERVAEGVALEEIRKLPQIISGFSPAGLAAARAVFEPLGVDLLELTPMEAEITKLCNNVYRYITFAVANQFYMLASDWNIDFHRILHAMKFNYPRAAHMPAPGFAAGPCLFKDTMQMSAFNNNQFFLGHAAMLVNEGLPQFVVNRMLRRWPDLRSRKVGILGMAFKAESDDTRESLSYKLKKILSLHCAEVLTTDPYVADPALQPLEEVVRAADILVVGAPHRRYKTLDTLGKPVVDVWNHLGKGSTV
jgi:UDP-N-acetyl-D-mannosaminuronic acid dehydrogenase